jgi:hypothetical protein
MAQPPWTHSTALGGEFYYNPRTDEIVMKTGQHFARPRQMMEVPSPCHSNTAARHQGLPIVFLSLAAGNKSYQIVQDLQVPEVCLKGPQVGLQPA